MKLKYTKDYVICWSCKSTKLKILNTKQAKCTKCNLINNV